MGKKYLLYIHDIRFQDELNKSALINGLLEAHYGGVEKAPHKVRTTKEILQPAVALTEELKPTKKLSFQQEKAREVHDEMLHRLGLLK